MEEAVGQARAWIGEERWDEAARLLEEVKRDAPDHIQGRYLLGYVFYRQRQLAEARRELEWVAAQSPEDPYSRYFLGRTALLKNQPEEAIRWLGPQVESGAPVHDALIQLGKAYFDAGHLDKSQELTELGLRQAPWDAALHYRLGRIYQRLGHEGLAREELRTSERLRAADFASVQRLQECSRLVAEGRHGDAKRMSAELLEDQRLDPDVLVSLGLIFANAGMAAEAAPAFLRAAERDRDFFQAQYNSGLTMLKLGELEKAEAPLRRARELVPGAADVNTALGLLYVMTQRFSEAVEPLEAVYAADPANVRVAGLLGLSYVRSGAAEKAAPVLEQAVAEAGADPKLHFALIESLQAAGRHDEAFERAGRAIEQFPQAPQGYLAGARELLRRGEYQQAGPLFEKAAALEPANIAAWLGLGEVRQKAGEYERSLEAYQEAARRDSNDVTAQLGVAKNLALLNRLHEAREVLEQMLPKHPAEPQLRFELARVYARLGDREAAARQREAFQRLSGGGSTAAGTPAAARP